MVALAFFTHLFPFYSPFCSVSPFAAPHYFFSVDGNNNQQEKIIWKHHIVGKQDPIKATGQVLQPHATDSIASLV
jgi:hypothetical protein